MSFRLIDCEWGVALSNAVQADHSNARIICPFIKKRALSKLFGEVTPQSIQIITRFNLDDFCAGVSDLSALRWLLENGAAIRGVRNLHAKLYLFGSRHAIATSANLTERAFLHNHEFGFAADDAEIVSRCQQYFADLWGRAGLDLTLDRLAAMESKLTVYLASAPRPTNRPGLGDEGADAGLPSEPIELAPSVGDVGQAFVKFFGRDASRALHTMPTLEEVQRSGCHWACTYPTDKRPRNVEDGAVMFMGRLVKEPRDILIFGRAIGMRHVSDRDSATEEEVRRRRFKEHYPRYIRVHHAEFVAGNLENGVSLNELMGELQANAFGTTQRHAASGTGNTDPRKAYSQQPSVELTEIATSWLNERLQAAFARFGKLPAADLAALDWPVVAGMPGELEP